MSEAKKDSSDGSTRLTFQIGTTLCTSGRSSSAKTSLKVPAAVSRGGAGGDRGSQHQDATEQITFWGVVLTLRLSRSSRTPTRTPCASSSSSSSLEEAAEEARTRPLLLLFLPFAKGMEALRAS